MKRLITTHILLLCLSLSAQDFQDVSLEQSNTVDANTSNYNPFDQPAFSINETFEEAADRNEIAHRTIDGLKSVENSRFNFI